VRMRNAFVVYRKEALDMFRDRRTLMGIFLFPLLVFPLMSAGLGEVLEKSVQRTKQEATTVMLLGAEHAPQTAARLREAEGISLVPAAADYVRQINEKKLRAAVEFPAGFEEKLRAGADAPKVKVYFYRTELRSETAADRIEELLTRHREGIVVERLSARGLRPALLKPIQVEEQNVAEAQKVGGSKLGRILPYFIILLCVTGALHPAIDLTAGEKERGTMETILCSGVGRGELVLGKFLFVLTTSLITTSVSVLSFIFSLSLAPTYRQEMTGGFQFTLTPQAAGMVFLLVLPLAVMFSGALLALALMAKSYKEAQSYTGYLMLTAIIPAMFSLLPGVELNAKLALIPVINVSLTAKEIFSGNYPWGLLSLVFLSSVVYGALGLFIAFRQFHREEVLFRE